MQNEFYHNEKLSGTPEYYLMAKTNSQKKTLDDIDATTCALNRAKGICGMLTTAFDGSEEYTFSNSDVSNSIWAIEGLIEQAMILTVGNNEQEQRKLLGELAETTQCQIVDKNLLNEAFPSDYFIINPTAPKVVNIDVLNNLVRNAETLINVINKNLSADNSVINHKDIIEMAFMAEDYSRQAIQALSQGNQDGGIIDSLESAISILAMVELNGESLADGFTSSNFTISKAMETASKTLNEAHKRLQSIPNSSIS